MNRNILVHAHNTRSQDEYSTRCIFAQMPAISIRTAVQLSRLSILHELSSTDTARRRTRKTVICAGRALADCTEDEIGAITPPCREPVASCAFTGEICSVVGGVAMTGKNRIMIYGPKTLRV
jgi:hypothetical protein